jgi:hypothetical protein
MARRLLLAISVAGATIGGDDAARAQNLLTNPEFDDFGTTGDADDPFPEWDSRTVLPTAGDDADLCPGSDSHRQDADSQASGVIATVGILVTPEETLHLEVTYRSSAPFEMRLLQSPHQNCTQTPIPIEPPPPDIPASADWATVRQQRTVASTTQSVLLWLRGEGEGDYFLQLDRAYVGRAERIFADDFEGGMCRWDQFDDGLPA